MKYISRLTALLLAVMLMVSSAGAMSVDDLTLGTMNMLYESVSEDAYTNLEAGVLGEEYELEAFADMTNKALYSFQWYDVDGNALPSADNPWCMNATVTMEEQQFYCVATDADNVSLKSAIMVLPAAQTTELDEYVGYLSSVALDNDTGLYNKEQIYYFLTNTWNVDSNGINLGAGVVSEWRNEWSDSEWYFDMMCTCVVDGKVEADTCVLYPGTSLHAEGCEWAGEGEVIEPDIPQPPLYYGDPQGNQYIASAEYTLPMNGGRAVILPKGSRAFINAEAADGAQWQVYDGAQWVDIAGETSACLTVTNGKLNTIFELTGVAELRYFSKDSQTVLASVSVTSDEIANGDYAEPVEEQLSLFAVERAETGKHTIVINYLFNNNEIVTSPYTATIEKGGTFNATVPNPIVRGYKLAASNASNVPAGFTYQEAQIAISVEDIQADMKFDVYYEPTTVSYTVIHYAQNIDNDNYTEVARENLTGLTNTQVPEVALDSEHRTIPKPNDFDPTGFFSLVYEKANIAADGSTVVEVYYDRNYYLLSFDLGGGYGVEPIYVRFGTLVGDVADPTRAGYAFLGWSLDGKTKVELPDTVPAEKRKYIALWAPGDTYYTVVYWLQNANPNKDADGEIVKDENGEPVYGYSVWGSKRKSALTDATVSGGDDVVTDGITTQDSVDKRNAVYMETLTERDVAVKGDGTTVVNVYYDRVEYTLKFYYAMDEYTTDEDDAAHFVIGGSTYYFGKHNGEDTQPSYKRITDQYMKDGDVENQRGEVVSPPTLNATGLARGYKSGFDTDAKVITEESNGVAISTTYNYKYYYIAFTAKYGADISELWPCDVIDSVTRTSKVDDKNGWAGTEAFVSAWNGEYRVYYSWMNANETIKGNYNQLDTNLLWNYDIYQKYADDDNTVEYLCFWENGAPGPNWNVPKLFRYQIWVPVLDGAAPNGAKTKVENGITYYLRNTYDTVDDSKPADQTAPAIEGLRYTGHYTDNGIDDFDETLYKEAKEVHFYYARNTYLLTYVNEGETLSAQLYPFEADISGTSPDMDLPENYPGHSLEAGGYEWEGWYTHSECLPGTKFNLEGRIMPANNITLYANWVPVTHNVFFYLDKADMEKDEQLENGALTKTVSHGTILNKDQVPGGAANNGLTFIGWFYEDDGVEKAIDFESMPITQDLKVYGKWSSNILKAYTVYFKIKGEDTEIADPITGSTLAGMTKTFDAKGGEELKPEYREGYFPEVKSHSLTLSIDDANNTGANTFTFWYVPKVAVPYIVRYWVQEADGTTKMQEQVLHSDNKKAVVTETFKVFTGYMPDAYQKRLVISEEALGEGEEWIKVNGVLVHPDNVINFYYKKDEVNAYYKVSHWLEPLTGDNWIEYGTGTQAQGKIDITQLKAEDFDLALDGYTFDVAKTECIYGGVETSKKVVGNGSVTLPQEGLELKLYYVRNEYPYEIRHVELNTGVMLEQTETGKAKYGDTKTGAPKTIPGYTYKQVNPQEGQISIRVEKSDTVKLNIITYYYVENDVEIKYVGVAPNGTTFDVCGTLSADAETVKVMSGTALGSTAAAKLPAFKFVGWYDKDKKLLSTEARYVPGKTAKISVYDAATGTYVEKDAYESATYYAKFEWNYADLTITKKVVEEIGFKAPEGTEFAFTVKLTGVLPSNTISVSIGDTTTQTEKSMTLDENNVLAFSLKDGQTAVIHDLPVGTEYEVEETVPFNFSVWYDGNETGAIPADGVKTTVTNFYPLRYGELTVTKTGLSKDNESAIVDVVITTNKVKTTYTLVLNKDNPTATIAKIQVGSTYTVTERTGWTWLYSDGPAYDKATGTIGDEPTTCTITNHSYSDQWMHDESYLVNNFGTGSNAGVNE